MLLVLTHLHTDLALLGLRVGARIVVYNAHRIRSPLGGGGGGSGGLPGGGGGGGWAVGACGTTSFEIERFSPWDTPSWPRYGTACGSYPLPTAASTLMDSLGAPWVPLGAHRVLTAGLRGALAACLPS